MPVAPENDRALVRRMLAGDERAFDAFFESYFPGLYRFALVRLGDDGDAAEEVVQAALSLAVLRLSTFRGEAALFSWLCTFCRHEISAYYKRRNREAARLWPEEREDELQAALDALAADSENLPERLLQRKELARLVRAALDSLPPRYGDALEWKYIEGLPVVEIARRLKLGPKAAESLLTRARDAFREGFAAVCGGRAGLERELGGTQ